jgi:hypothetical protein
MSLYAAAVAMLIERRDIERGISDVSGLDRALTARDKISLLQDLAWRLSLNNRSELSAEQAATYLSRKLRTMSGADAAADAEDYLRYLVQRSGLIRSPAPHRRLVRRLLRPCPGRIPSKAATHHDYSPIRRRCSAAPPTLPPHRRLPSIHPHRSAPDCPRRAHARRHPRCVPARPEAPSPYGPMARVHANGAGQDKEALFALSCSADRAESEPVR